VSDPAQKFLFPFFLLLFICFGFWQSARFIVRANPELDAYPGLRVGWLLFTFSFSMMLYLAGRELPIARSGLFIANTANLFVFANLLGAWMVKPLKRPAELIILCVVVALSDLFSVLKGPTRMIINDLKVYYETGMAGPAPAGDFLMIKVVVPGAADLQPVFGVSDWIILVFLSAAACRFGINDNLAGKSLSTMADRNRVSFYFPVAGLGLFSAVAAALFLQVFVPVLPLVALVYIAYILAVFPSSRKLKKSDWLLVMGVSSVMLCLLGVGYVL